MKEIDELTFIRKLSSIAVSINMTTAQAAVSRLDGSFSEELQSFQDQISSSMEMLDKLRSYKPSSKSSLEDWLGA